MRPWISYFVDTQGGVILSADRQTAYNVGPTNPWSLVKSNPSGTGNIYVELTVGAGGNNIHVGVANANAPANNYVGATPNGLSWSNNGNVYSNGVVIGPIFNFNPGDVLAIAVYGQLQLIQFRNITQNTAWSSTYSLVSVGKPPYLLAVSFDSTLGGSVHANFYGPFVGTMPTAIPAFTIWNPEALFSEQPVKVLDVDAVIADGSYTSTNVNDLVQLSFSSIRWGDANLDAQNNLRFTDWVWSDSDDDLPLLSITVQVTAQPANNYIWGEWDYSGTTFLITRFHISTTNPIAVSNIPIPPPTATPPAIGQGRVLQLFSSCDTGTVFNWTNGRVFGTETTLVWQPIEYATFPPSIAGRTYTLTGGTSPSTFPTFTPLFPPPLVGQGGGAPPTFPPPTPPPIGHIPAGVLVGPAIAAASVPPSVAGITQPVFTFGNATTPPVTAAFPQQTTTYPHPPIIINSTQNTNTPIWVPPPQPPPTQASTPPLGLSYNTGGQWGPPIGPALPPVVPGGTRPFITMETMSEGGSGGAATMSADNHVDDEPPLRPRRGRRRHV
jgi:hypothetical protein